jgi:hypothetical protein
MNSLALAAGLVSLLLLPGSSALSAPAVNCHIHPPGSTPEKPVGIVGPFVSPAACERERAVRYGPAGRCHCAADFSPRWLPTPEITTPGQSPLG